jgi:hypothetical protein
VGNCAIGAVGITYLALLALTVLEGRGGWNTFARIFNLDSAGTVRSASYYGRCHRNSGSSRVSE